MSGPIRFGRYLLDRELGRGGMGTVYAARDTALGDRAVAIKVINDGYAGDEGFLRRFHAEASALASMDSPHIIAIHEHGEIEGRAFIAAQYIAGGSLTDLLHASGPLPPARAAEVCAQVADALADAHAAGIVHRDVKPQNVLIRDPGAAALYAYLCDFGIAQAEHHRTTTAGVAGSFGYLAPERLRGQRATPASDVYSLGCTLWACLTGRPPYTGTDASVAMAHLEAPPPRLAADDDLSARINHVVARSMAKDVRHRYRSAGEFAADLRTLAEYAHREGASGPIDATVAATPLPGQVAGHRPGGRRRSRLPLAGMVAGALVLALGGAGAWWTLTDQSGPDGTDGTDTAGSGLATRGPEPERKAIPGFDLKTTKATPPAGLAPNRDAAPDFDDDGYADVGVSAYDTEGKSLRTWSMTPDGVTKGGPLRAEGIDDLWGDFDGDGRTDTAAVKSEFKQGIRVTVTLSRPGGTAVRSSRLVGNEGSVFVTAASGDFDGDGRDDLAFTAGTSEAKAPDSEVWVARGTGTGLAEPTRWLTTTDQLTLLSTPLAGQRRDGLILLTGRLLGSWTATTYRSTGTRFVRYGEPTEFSGYEGVSPRFVVADFTGDGEGDLAWIPREKNATEGVRVLPGDGSGGFAEEAVWVDDPMPGSSYLIGAVDVDQDGTTDLVQYGPVKRSNALLSVRRSDGKGFGDAERWDRLRVENRENLPALVARASS